MTDERRFRTRAFWACFVFLINAPLSFGATQGERHAEGEKEEAHAEEGVVRLSPEALKMTDLRIQTAGGGTIRRFIRVPGEVGFNADRLTHLTPRVSGVASQVAKTVGDRVRAGEMLAVLQSTELGNAKIEYTTAKLNLELARTNLAREKIIHDNTAKLLKVLKNNPETALLEKWADGSSVGKNKSKLLTAYSALRLARSAWARARKLKRDDLISATEYDLAAKELESAQAEYRGAFEEITFNYKLRFLKVQQALRLAQNAFRNADRRLHILGLTEKEIVDLGREKDADIARYVLRAPFSGTIIKRHVAPGEHLEEDTVAFTIADLSTVWVNLRIYTRHLPEVRVDLPVQITMPGSMKPRSGKIAVLYPVVDERTRSATARVILDNMGGALRPGLFVTGALLVDERRVPLAVPVGAVQRIANRPVVFVRGGEKGEFVPMPVKLGRSDERLVEILTGLKPGARVVVDGAFILKSEFMKAGFEAGHAH